MRLIADIGGTNARFALADGSAAIRPLRTVKVADYPSFVAALEAVIADGADAVAGVAVAAAGPTDGKVVRLTNADWTIRADEVAAALGGVPARLFNDLEAVALALPFLGDAEMALLHAGAPVGAPAPRLAVNVGTGFGAAVAIPRGDGWSALAGEAGHMRFAPVSPDETALATEAVVIEDVLSGRGYRRLERLVPDDAARRAAFSALLGRAAGDIAATFGAWGGVYFCGGVLDGWAEYVDFAELRAAFVAKGPMTARMSAIPLYRLTASAPALVGLAHAPLDDVA